MENIVVGQTVVEEDTLMDIIVKLNLNINVKIKYETSIQKKNDGLIHFHSS